MRQLVARLLNEVTERRQFEVHGGLRREATDGDHPREWSGVPAEDAQAKLDAWITELLAPDDPEYSVSPAVRAATTRQLHRVRAHPGGRAASCSPRDDLLSRLMAAEVDGVKLRYEEFGMFFMLLLGAGTHTSRLTLGNGVLALIRHPDQRERLLAAPGLITSAVEEILRYEPPIMHFRRTATRDAEIRGQRIEKGQKVVLWYTSANRDGRSSRRRTPSTSRRPRNDP